MSEWLVRLKGDEFDLEALSARFQSTERSVRKEENGYHYLRSASFDSMTDNKAVRERALELIERMNGAAKFHLGEDFQPVEFDGIMQRADDGRRDQFIYLDPIETRSRVSLSTTIIKEGVATEPPQPSDDPDALVTLAEQDERVADALRFFARGDWVNLYKAWEVVGDAAGGAHAIIANGWADRTEQGRFTGTAQSKDELGDDARHASGKYKAPKHPMTLDEARAFVKSVIEAWAKTL